MEAGPGEAAQAHRGAAVAAVGIGHAFIILALNIGLFSLLGMALRKKLFLVCAAYAGLVYSTRILGEDRYESTSLWALGAIFTLWMLRTIWPWVTGLLAIALATPGLWGRVPVYTTPVDEQILFLVPGAVATILAGIILGRDGPVHRLVGPIMGGMAIIATHQDLGFQPSHRLRMGPGG